VEEFADIGVLPGMGCEGRGLVDEMYDPVRFAVDDGAIEDVAVRGADVIIPGRGGQAADTGQLLDGGVDDLGGRLLYLFLLVALLGLDIAVGVDDDTVAEAALVQHFLEGLGDAEAVRLGRIHIREGPHAAARMRAKKPIHAEIIANFGFRSRCTSDLDPR